MKKKTLTILVALVLAVGCAVGTTLAWLTDKTAPVQNVFTVGNIDITLKEEAKDFKMIPGCTIKKDPVVTVEANSEPCWLFVKVQESDNLKDFITYEVDRSKWNSLDTEPNVYYCTVPASNADQTFPVLTGNVVTVQETVTKEMMDGVTQNGNNPTLTFTAYACQKENFETAGAAWAEVNQ